MPQLLPLHESLVKSLPNLEDFTVQSQEVILLFLADLLPMTSIPANHDAIAAALKSAFARTRYGDIKGVVASILAQKAEHQARQREALGALERADVAK